VSDPPSITWSRYVMASCSPKCRPDLGQSALQSTNLMRSAWVQPEANNVLLFQVGVGCWTDWRSRICGLSFRSCHRPVNSRDSHGQKSHRLAVIGVQHGLLYATCRSQGAPLRSVLPGRPCGSPLTSSRKVLWSWWAGERSHLRSFMTAASDEAKRTRPVFEGVGAGQASAGGLRSQGPGTSPTRGLRLELWGVRRTPWSARHRIGIERGFGR
jgi:hypothetical protein